MERLFCVIPCYNEQEVLPETARRLSEKYDKLISLGFEVVKPQGAFYLLMKSPFEDESKLVDMAKKHHIIFASTKTFGCPGYVRIAYCVDYEMIKRSFPAFDALAKECKM